MNSLRASLFLANWVGEAGGRGGSFSGHARGRAKQHTNISSSTQRSNRLPCSNREWTCARPTPTTGLAVRICALRKFGLPLARCLATWKAGLLFRALLGWLRSVVGMDGRRSIRGRYTQCAPAKVLTNRSLHCEVRARERDRRTAIPAAGRCASARVESAPQVSLPISECTPSQAPQTS